MTLKATSIGSVSNGSTKTLLVCGLVAGPLYMIVGLIQVLIRPGFDITRHDLSLMSNGDLGWIQITNFLVAGLLVIASAVGMQRILHPGRRGTWGPLLVGIYGLGLIGAGVFTADPAYGFPPGTPADAHTISWHGLLHFISGGVGFLALIAACFVFARRFAAFGQRGWAAYSVATGVIFFAAFFGIASGSGQAWIVIGFWFGVALAWAWISAMSARLRKLILEAAPDITEEWKWGTAVWSQNGLICSAGAFKDHVKLNFFEGASLKDPKGLFNSGLDAKATRAIDFNKGHDIDESALKGLIRAAVVHNMSSGKKK